MASFSRIEVAQKIYETGMIPIFYNKDIVSCKKKNSYDIIECINIEKSQILKR